MHWQIVDDIPRPESQDVRLASVETESTALIHFSTLTKQRSNLSTPLSTSLGDMSS